MVLGGLDGIGRAHLNPKSFSFGQKGASHFAPSQLYFTQQLDGLITSFNHSRNIQNL